MTAEHMAPAAALKDPFDRLLIAQARYEGMSIVTAVILEFGHLNLILSASCMLTKVVISSS